MSVSALNNTNYYFPNITTKSASNSETVEANTASNQTQVQQVDENNTKIQETPNSYASNQENTSNNNSSQNNADNAPVYTGEEMLSAMSQNTQNQTESTDAKQKKQSSENTQNNTGEKLLTEEEQKQVEELKVRDMEVKAHEQAHIAAGGSYVKGAASYDYQTGPDGKKYAVGGEVSIDTSAVEGDPQATINKAQVIIKAALAPAEPSGQDRAVASQARQMMANARKELMSEKTNTESNSTADSTAAEKTQSENNQNKVESTNENNNTETVETTNDNTIKTASVNTQSASNNISTENTNSKSSTPVVNDTPKMATQSLKTESVNIPQVNVSGSGLYQAFSNAGMSPIKNANALMQVAGSLISLMA